MAQEAPSSVESIVTEDKSPLGCGKSLTLRSFSRRSILAQEKLVQDKVEVLCKGFNRCHSKDSPISISGAFAAFTADVISQYSFGFSYGQLESDGWKDNFQSVYTAMNEFGHILVQLPWLNAVTSLCSKLAYMITNVVKLLMSLPDSVVTTLSPDFGRMLQLKRVSFEHYQLQTRF